MSKIGVGVIGASPSNPGWAVTSHLPAIRFLPEFELAAVSTSNATSAKAAADEYGIPAFDNAADLIRHPNVDLVVVAVKVTHHDALIKPALEAGKMVLSEWPLGADIEQSIRLADMAAKARVRTFIGMQARFAPAIQQARALIRDGYIGSVLGTTLVGSAESWGSETIASRAYIFDASKGATMLNITMSHVLDAVNYVLGDFTTVSARLGVGRKTVRLVDDNNREIPRTSPDQLAIAATIDGGATASIFFRGGRSRGQNFHWEINGSDGDLILEADSGKLHISKVKLSGGQFDDPCTRDLEIPSDPLPEGVAEYPGGNVCRLYSALASDIRNGSHIVPDFSHALGRHRLLDAIEKSSMNAMPLNLEPSKKQM